MLSPGARAEISGQPEALRGRYSLAGLTVLLELRGGEEAWARLAPHQLRAPEAEATAGAPAGASDEVPTALLRAFPGPAPKFEHLTIETRGQGFVCEGDGLRGEISASHADLDVYGGEPALLAALRLCCSIWLATRGGLLLHGACIEPAPGGRALSLLGPSGVGKTTVSRRLQAAGARVISDEVTAVRGARLFGHPLARRLGDGLTGSAGLPLAALGFLSQSAPGAEPSVRPLSQREAARALLLRVFLPALTPALLAGALGTCERLAATVPAFAVSIPDDARAVRCALSLAPLSVSGSISSSISPAIPVARSGEAA